jgi:predicted GNAT family acetyltransferase
VLVRAALRRAADDHLTVVPQCPFARKWLLDHADEIPVGASIDWQSEQSR